MTMQGDICQLYVEAVMRLYIDLADLERLTESKESTVRLIRARSWAVAYMMGKVSRKGFGSTIWREGIME